MIVGQPSERRARSYIFGGVALARLCLTSAVRKKERRGGSTRFSFRSEIGLQSGALHADGECDTMCRATHTFELHSGGGPSSYVGFWRRPIFTLSKWRGGIKASETRVPIMDMQLRTFPPPKTHSVGFAAGQGWLSAPQSLHLITCSPVSTCCTPLVAREVSGEVMGLEGRVPV